MGSRAILVVTGPNPALVRSTLNSEGKRILADQSPVIVDLRLAGEEYAAVDRLADAFAPDLFAGSRPVQVDHLDFADDAVMDLLKREFQQEGPPILVAHYGSAKGKAVINAAKQAKAKVVSVKRPTEQDLRQQVRSTTKQLGGAISRDAEDLLFNSAVADDPDLLLAAVKQCVADAPSGKVSAEQVAAQFPDRAAASSFDVGNLVWDRRLADAIALVRTMALHDSATAVSVIAALTHGVRQMALSGTSANMAPWQRDRAKRQAKRWGATAHKLAQISAELPWLDVAMKGGLADAEALDDEQKLALLEQVLLSVAED